MADTAWIDAQIQQEEESFSELKNLEAGALFISPSPLIRAKRPSGLKKKTGDQTLWPAARSIIASARPILFFRSCASASFDVGYSLAQLWQEHVEVIHFSKT